MAEKKTANPIQVQKYLKGIDYPSSKTNLVKTAKREGADDTVLDTLGRLPEQTYDGPNEVAKEIGKLA